MKTFDEITVALDALAIAVAPFKCTVNLVRGEGTSIKLFYKETRSVATLFVYKDATVIVDLYAPTTSYLHISTEGLDQAQAMGLFAAFVRENFTCFCP